MNNNNEQIILPEKVKIEDFIKIENLVENINEIVKNTYISLKSEVSKNILDQYGSLNINAEIYVPKNKILNNNMTNINNDNFNYHSNYENNYIPSQNFISQYYNNYN